VPDLVAPRCAICLDAGWLRAPGLMGTVVRCVCQRRPEPEPPEPPANVVPLRRGGGRG
jgi:hypothetical protein